MANNLAPLSLTLTTNRLALNPLSTNDAAFIFELVNSPGWIQFIGDRNVKNQDDSIAYIQRILANSNIQYWVASLQEGQNSIGIITFIKRDYLECHDLGFAFLPRFGQKGYAYEASKAVLEALENARIHSRILATTLKNNISSIGLLEKLGFRFERIIEDDKEDLLVYGIDLG